MTPLPVAPPPESPWVFRLQLAILAGFTLFALAIVSWVFRLIYISWVWHDVFSASIGIALVAVPIFLFLLATFNYVFWGVLLGRKERGAPQPPRSS
mgnify:CR=1 FL=1